MPVDLPSHNRISAGSPWGTTVSCDAGLFTKGPTCLKLSDSI